MGLVGKNAIIYLVFAWSLLHFITDGPAVSGRGFHYTSIKLHLTELNQRTGFNFQNIKYISNHYSSYVTICYYCHGSLMAIGFHCWYLSPITFNKIFHTLCSAHTTMHIKECSKQTCEYANCHRDTALWQWPIVTAASTALYSDMVYVIFMNHPHFMCGLLVCLTLRHRTSTPTHFKSTDNYENTWIFQAIHDSMFGSPCVYIHPNYTRWEQAIFD